MNILTDERNHQEWMNKLLVDARILAPNYPCKGESGWLPYGYSIANNLILMFAEKMQDIGFKEIALPSFVKGEIFLEQCNNIKDFRKRVYWSDPFKKNDMQVVKPTIEAQISALFSRWIKDGRKGPYKYFTYRSVGRYETGRTLPLWKERIVWPFFEGHSMHIEDGDLESTIESQNKVLEEVYALLGLPFFVIQRPKVNKRLQEYSERRLETISITPYKRVVILSSIYDLGEIFSKVYSLKAKDGKYYPMVNFAFSGRLIGTIFSNFCDEKGLRLPSVIAPHHIRIVTIENGSNTQKDYVEKIVKEFEDSSIRVNIDTSSSNFKEKINKAKTQGVPLIMLIGDKEVSSNFITILRRDTNQLSGLKRGEIVASVKKYINNYDGSLRKWSENMLSEVYTVCEERDKLVEFAKADKLIEVALCEEEDCLLKLADISGTEIIGSIVDKHGHKGQKCISCAKIARQNLLLGKKWKGEK